jgi:hypothetical protein
MTRETALQMAAQFIIVELIGEGITSKEAIMQALKTKEVQERVAMCADVLMQELK